MKLFTQSQHDKLISNGSGNNRGKDHIPVIKLFTPDANATWLLTEIDPEEPDLAFGLCDLGPGFPELGYVSIQELSELRGVFGLPVECDLHFEGSYSISVYADAARAHSGIVENNTVLGKYCPKQKSCPRPE